MEEKKQAENALIENLLKETELNTKRTASKTCCYMYGCIRINITFNMWIL